MTQLSLDSRNNQDFAMTASESAPIALPAMLAGQSLQLIRMFRDPRVLDKEERAALIEQLRATVELKPSIPEIRVVLGMALCVDFQPQEAMEELRTATQLDPNCFIARLKFGELLMRLRICDQAAEETHKAALLAANDMQAELARRQAASIRTMMREGIERGGYRGLLDRLTPKRGKSKQSESTPLLAGSR